MANFLVNMLLSRSVPESDFVGPDEWAKWDSVKVKEAFPHLVAKRNMVIEQLNQGTGVVVRRVDRGTSVWRWQ